MNQLISPANVTDSNIHTAPLVIGGNGGSGTRLVAEILMQTGMFMGHDLNRSNDNLLFTYLFKRPGHHARNLKEANPQYKALLTLHEKLFFRNARPTLKEIGLIIQAGRDHIAGPYYGRRWLLQRWSKMMRPGTAVSSIERWGWKEPHTMFFLPELMRYYHGLKFVLVLRDGLDMAYSQNDQQFKHWDWSPAYELQSDSSSPQDKFEFWYRSNQEAIHIGETHLGVNFLVLKFEDLCMKSEESISQLLHFAEISVADAPEAIWSLPVLPTSHGRYRQFNSTWINQEVKRKLSEIGYEMKSGV